MNLIKRQTQIQAFLMKRLRKLNFMMNKFKIKNNINLIQTLNKKIHRNKTAVNLILKKKVKLLMIC